MEGLVWETMRDMYSGYPIGLSLPQEGKIVSASRSTLVTFF